MARLASKVRDAGYLLIWFAAATSLVVIIASPIPLGVAVLLSGTTGVARSLAAHRVFREQVGPTKSGRYLMPRFFRAASAIALVAITAILFLAPVPSFLFWPVVRLFLCITAFVFVHTFMHVTPFEIC